VPKVGEAKRWALAYRGIIEREKKEKEKEGGTKLGVAMET
jgi:hypothetical protein